MAAGDVIGFAHNVATARALAQRTDRVFIFFDRAPGVVDGFCDKGVIQLRRDAFLDAVQACAGQQPLPAELIDDSDGRTYLRIGNYTAVERMRERA